MTDALEAFLASVPGSSALLSKQGDTVALFGFFVSQVLGLSITPSNVEDCYAAAHLRAPKNISDTMAKSGAFVRDRNGWSLHREVVQRLKNTQAATLQKIESNPELENTVMVVYGQDEDSKRDLFNLLRSVDIKPIEWNSAIAKTGRSSPYVGEILNAAFSMAQAFLVFMTPDEEAVLRPGLRKKTADGTTEFQPSPNVLLEAGMALATDEKRTILVSVGPIRSISDLEGRHVVRLDNSADRRNDLIARLRIAGCVPKTEGTDWIHTGNFERFA